MRPIMSHRSGWRRRCWESFREAYVTDTVTGGNWEGHGIKPDLVCAADAAVTEAVRHLHEPGHSAVTPPGTPPAGVTSASSNASWQPLLRHRLVIQAGRGTRRSVAECPEGHQVGARLRTARRDQPSETVIGPSSR